MARIAVLMDRTMESIGLSGKSFIPMIIGFGVMYLVLWQHGVLKMKRKTHHYFNCTFHVMFGAIASICYFVGVFLKSINLL